MAMVCPCDWENPSIDESKKSRESLESLACVSILISFYAMLVSWLSPWVFPGEIANNSFFGVQYKCKSGQKKGTGALID